MLYKSGSRCDIHHHTINQKGITLKAVELVESPVCLEDAFTEFLEELLKAKSLVEVQIAAGIALQVLGLLPG